MDMKLKESVGSAPGSLLVLAELTCLVAFFVLDYLGIIQVPISTTIPLLLFAWLSLRLRGKRWRDVGWQRPFALGKTTLIALLAACVMQAVSFLVVIPTISQLTGDEIDLSLLDQLDGNVGMLLIGLLLIWTLAAVGEELVYRGYLLNRLADLFGNGAVGLILALLLSSALFGFVHAYQGVVGMVDTFINGLIAGGLYIASGRKLWLPILYHGIYDTIALLLAFARIL
ncbi:MAG: CPBP family intramembrane metalloprotease [Anaerolineae bacterium]|nr:CPBP family intramembrane metalloprotease [Anaerolineae bacterium]